MDPFNNINPSRVSDRTRTDDAGSQPQQADQASFQEHLNALQPGWHWPAVPNSRLARRRGGLHADATGSRLPQEEGAGEGGSRLPFAPPAHSPVQSFDQDEVFAAADRAGPLPAASFASAQFWQEAERVAHSPAPSVNQEEHPRRRAAIGDASEALSSMPPPRVNLPGRGFGRAAESVNPPDVVADAYRPAANQQRDLTGARHTMPTEATRQGAVVQQTRSRKRSREHPDEMLFAAYGARAKASTMSEGSIERDITALRKFSTWLEKKHQSQIQGRTEDEQLDSLTKDFAANNAKLLNQLNVALGRLRQVSAGQPVKAASNVRPGTKDDEEIFAEYQAKAVAAGLKEGTMRGDLAALRKFSKWLEKNHGTQIVGRMEDRQLDILAKDFAGDNTKILYQLNGGLGRLRQASAGHWVVTGSSVPSGTKDDEELLAEYQTKAVAAGIKESTWRGDVSTLRKFSAWLEGNHQSQIYGRIEDRQLDRLAAEFAGNDTALLSHVNIALKRLRQASAGQPVKVARTVQSGTKDDEELLAKYQTKAAAAGLNESTGRGDIAALRKLSAWLTENHRTQIVDRLDDPGLDRLVAAFADREGRRIHAALARLRQASAGQPVVAAPTIRGTKDDEELFAKYQAKAAAAGLNDSTMKGDLLALRKFSAWLEENRRTQISDRLDDPGLDALAAAFVDRGGGRIHPALGRLRQASTEQRVTAAKGRPISQENQVIEDACKAAASRYPKSTLSTYRGILTRFDRWLHQNFAKGITQIEPAVLSRAVEEYKKNAGQTFGTAWGFLQRYRQMVEANNALGLSAHGQAAPPQQASDPPTGTAQSVPFSPIPMSPGDPAWDVLRAFNQEETAQPRAPTADQVIEDACKAAASWYRKSTLSSYRSILGRFNEWLGQNFGKGISQIEPAVLSRAVEEYKKNVGPTFGTAWGFLQRYRQMVAANDALGLSAHGQAAPRQEPSGPPTGAVQSVPFSPIPMSPGDPAWDVLRAFYEEDAAQRGAPTGTSVPQFHQTTSLPPQLAPVSVPSSPAQSADSSSTFAGLAPLSPAPYRRPDFDLNALTPEQLAEDADSGSRHWAADAGSAITQPGSSRRSSQIYAGLDDIVDLQDDAGSAPRSDAARSRSIAGPSPSSSMPGEGSAASSAAHGRLPDLGPQLGSREQAGRGAGPAASQESYDQSQLWREVDQAGRQRPAGWERPWSGWSPQSDQDRGPTRRSASARSSDIYRGLGSLVDLPSTPAELRDDAHYAPPPATASEARAGAPDPRASSSDRSELALGATQWLGDQHIHADYELLEQELQRDNPDLAARTRLVDPLVAHYHLRLGSDDAALRAFQRIVYDRDGSDTADFLFLPVSNASATDPERRGTHWSLLLVDRRERERPVAYHYDSYGDQNGALAQGLAERLGARSQPVRMAQQANQFDCGVFVLDGTRALVRQLGQGRHPAVPHLDNLVVGRQALQTRLLR
ncbi:conserved hypothetical protein [Mesorhizobium sp. SOD10]|nr:conserved hypothetical protein [Mesorhizobium sp. SOD10]